VSPARRGSIGRSCFRPRRPPPRDRSRRNRWSRAGWLIAAGHYEDAIGQLRPLAAAGDPQARYFLAGSLGNLAEIEEFRGRVGPSVELLTEAIAIQRTIREADPKNAGAFLDLCMTSVARGTLMADRERSAERLHEAARLADEFGTAYAADFSAARVRCYAHASLAEGWVAVGRIDEADSEADAAGVYARSLAKYPKPFQAGWAQSYAIAARAAVLAARGQAADAKAEWDRAIALLEPYSLTSISDVLTHRRLIVLYERTGDPEDRAKAAAARARLREKFPECAVP
jgi:tetratricopeptide (TPR) repeat protein